MGRRAWKKVTENGTIIKHERYLYRGYLQIAVIDLTRSDLPVLRYLICDPTEPQATRPLALQAYGTWFTYGLDLTKNVKELYNSAGTVKTTYDYLPFGEVTVLGAYGSPVQWNSEVYDEELGLVYNHYRHYNPADGRWIKRDPIGVEGGLNLYGFVKNKVWVGDALGLTDKWKPTLVFKKENLGKSLKTKHYTGSVDGNIRFSRSNSPAQGMDTGVNAEVHVTTTTDGKTGDIIANAAITYLGAILFEVNLKIFKISTPSGGSGITDTFEAQYECKCDKTQ